MEYSKIFHHGTLWAVLIGVTEYDDPEWWPLPYCEKDATALGAVFRDQSRSGYPVTNIQLLVESAAERFLKPTCGNIRGAIRRLGASAGPDDTILFGFFGHGGEQEESRKEEVTSSPAMGGAGVLKMPLPSNGFRAIWRALRPASRYLFLMPVTAAPWERGLPQSP
jgi:hypothetical protein